MDRIRSRLTSSGATVNTTCRGSSSASGFAGGAGSGGISGISSNANASSPRSPSSSTGTGWASRVGRGGIASSGGAGRVTAGGGSGSTTSGGGTSSTEYSSAGGAETSSTTAKDGPNASTPKWTTTAALIPPQNHARSCALKLPLAFWRAAPEGDPAPFLISIRHLTALNPTSAVPPARAEAQQACQRGGLSGAMEGAGPGGVKRVVLASALPHDPAVQQMDRAVAVRGVRLGVRDLDDRRAFLLVQALEQLHDLLALRGVQVARRLGGEDDLRLGDDGPRHRHELLLTTRELVRVQVLLGHDLEAVEDVRHHRLPLLARHVPVGQRDLEDLRDREMVQQVVLLDHEADVLPDQLVAVFGMEYVDGMAHEPVLALPARVQHAQDAEQRGLASAGRPHDGEELAFTDVQVDLPQDVRASRLRLVVPLDAAQPDHRDSARGVSLEVFRATARGAD